MQRPRIPSKLSESVHHQLNAYALAASAAGVGMLALLQPAEAKIIYTPTYIRIDRHHKASYNLDLNHDGIYDFNISSSHYDKHEFASGGGLWVSPMNNGNQIWGTSRSASALSAGVQIGANSKFKKTNKLMVQWWQDCTSTGTSHCTSHIGGPWNNVQKRYLGLKFIVKGGVHYGWARLNVKDRLYHINAVLTGYAYETERNKPIIAGKTKGPDDVENYDPGPGASLTNPIPDTPQPASLGALAMGARGLFIWRRKESVAGTP